MRGSSRYELTKAKYLLDPEVDLLNQTLEKFKDSDFRDTTMIWALLHSGARATELLNITADDLDAVEKTVFIRGIKGSNNREIPLPVWLFKRMEVLAKGGGRLFPISYNRLRDIWTLYRGPFLMGKKLHALRHTFAITVYRKSKDLRLVQVALGHRSLTNTLIYSQYQYQSAELRKALVG